PADGIGLVEQCGDPRRSLFDPPASDQFAQPLDYACGAVDLLDCVASGTRCGVQIRRDLLVLWSDICIAARRPIWVRTSPSVTPSRPKRTAIQTIGIKNT